MVEKGGTHEVKIEPLSFKYVVMTYEHRVFYSENESVEIHWVF